MMIDTAHGRRPEGRRANTLQPGVPMIVLETALPIKFAETIVEALGREPDPRAGRLIASEAHRGRCRRRGFVERMRRPTLARLQGP